MLPKPLKHGLIFLRPNAFLLQPTADRNEEEHRPHGDALPRKQFGDGVHLRDVAARDRGVDLDADAQPTGVGQHGQRALEASLPAAKGIMRGGVGAVEADSQGPDSRVADASKAAAVAKGVAEGVKAVCSPRAAACWINSIRSPRFSGSPPVNTTVGVRGKVAA